VPYKRTAKRVTGPSVTYIRIPLPVLFAEVSTATFSDSVLFGTLLERVPFVTREGLPDIILLLFMAGV
jgi:hypothetical protein